MKLIIKIISPAIIVVGLFFALKTNEIHQPSGILAPDPPFQDRIAKDTNWEKENYNFAPIANFRTKAKVLSISNYK